MIRKSINWPKTDFILKTPYHLVGKEFFIAGMAEWLKHLTVNQDYEGSNPSASAKGFEA